MKFNIENYDDGSYVMHCKTEEEANIFCKYLHSLGKRWSNGSSYLNENYYKVFHSETCYDFEYDCYDNIEYFIESECTILEFSDFEWDGFYSSQHCFRVYQTDKDIIDGFLSGFQIMGV